MQEHSLEKIIVLKFGSSVLRTEADLPNAVHEIYRWVRTGYRVVAVVSAIGDTTDQLLKQARALSPSPESFATAELLATGERASAALLSLTLDHVGLPARALNPREIGLTVVGSPLDSELVSADVPRLRALLSDYPVLVVPGFFGTDAAGRTHLLGRGGSDLSAVFLAHALGARCRLIKDVDGVYESDPAACAGASPRRFAQLDYSDALRVAGQLIQPKAVAFLSEYGARAEVAALARPCESVVQGDPTAMAAAAPMRALKVLLLGLGTVGLGVYRRLQANPDFFQVIGILVRDRRKYEALGIPAGLLHSSPSDLLGARTDIVVDALPDLEPANYLVAHFLEAGTSVVSANKALVAEHGAHLAARVQEYGGRLRYSAAVGGSVPMIETVDRIAAERPIARATAVLNGTCNFVLDACAKGETLATAILDAQREGFAEADAAADLGGRDAERKLRILCRHAFRTEPLQIDVQVLDDVVARRAREVASSGRKLRQIALATREEGYVSASVRYEVVEANSLFGRLSQEWNALEIRRVDGRTHTVTGRGAGRWPTTEAVLSDLFDLHRQHSQA